MLTIRDLQSQETFSVPPEGAVLGREGGGADILVRDKSVSKRHAKVYERGGRWYLEDLQSANGTYVNDEPVTRPLAVKPGMSFSLSNYHFEVVGFEAGADAPTRAPSRAASMSDAWEADGGYPDETEPPPDEWEPAPAPARGNRAPASGSGRGFAARAGNGSARGAAARGGGRSASRAGASAGAEGAAGSVIGMIPRAIGHYLLAVPAMAVNPPGYIKRSIEEMKFPAMKPLELIAWGLPATLFNTGLAIAAGIIAALVGMIRAKAFGAGPIIAVFTAAIVALVIAVVVAIVSGFIFHPLMGFIIRLLKGESDETSRSNYYVCAMTAYVLLGLPAAATALLAVLPVPYIGVLPLVFALVASVVTLLVSYFWFKFFQVMKWVPIVILVLAGLNALNTLRGIVGVVRGGGAAAGTVALTAEQQAQIEAAKNAAGDAGAASAGTETESSSDADSIEAEAETGGAESADGGSKTGGAAESTASAAGTTDSSGDRAAVAGVKVASIPGNLTPYQRWAAKRDAVEKAIADDPTILKRDRELLAGYTRYHKQAHAIRQKWARQRRDVSQQPVVDRLIEADTYEATNTLVDQLYARIAR